MARWGEDILCLSLFSELLGEDLAFNVGVGTNVRDWQRDSFAHDLCIQIVAFDFLLDLARHQFDWIRVWPVVRFVDFALHVALVVNQMVVIDDYS